MSIIESAERVWIGLTEHQECPICGHRGWCGAIPDGTVRRCMRHDGEAAGWVKIAERDDDGGAVYKRADVYDPTPGNGHRRAIEPAPIRPPARDWATMAKSFCAAITAEKLATLAGNLGVTEPALRELRVGWHAEFGCYTFPERNADDVIIGISTRSESGEKKFLSGGQRGLTIPRRWHNPETDADDEPVYVVEGPSDVAACCAIGVIAIGRPSNRGGVDYLAQLLRGREIVVVGELDEKPDGAWPGRDGAIHTATMLADTLKQPVRWALFSNAKDAREWLRNEGADADAFRHELDENAVVVGEAYRLKKLVRSSTDVSRTMRAGIEKRKKSGGGILTGFLRLDDETGGLQRAEMTVLGGRVSNGKTTLAVTMMRNQLVGTIDKNGRVGEYRVGFFSAEMLAEIVREHLVCSLANLDTRVVRDVRWNAKQEREFYAADDAVCRLPWFINDRISVGLPEFIDGARQMVKRHRVDIIYLDFVQRMSRDGLPEDSDPKQIGMLSKAAVQIAKDYGIHVVLLAQLNREAARTPNSKKIPALPSVKDLKGSGDLEEDAENILFVHSDYVYTRDPADEHHALLILAKQRNGGLAEWRIRREMATSQFIDTGHDDFDDPQRQIEDAAEAATMPGLPNIPRAPANHHHDPPHSQPRDHDEWPDEYFDGPEVL